MQRARDILAGDLSGLPLGERWPYPATLDGLRMVAECQAGLVPESRPQAWLVLLDGVVIGECGTSGPANEAGDVEIGYGLAAPYRGLGVGTEMLVGLSRWLLAQDGVHRVTAGGVRADDIPSRRALERAGSSGTCPPRPERGTRCPRTVPHWFDRRRAAGRRRRR